MYNVGCASRVVYHNIRRISQINLLLSSWLSFFYTYLLLPTSSNFQSLTKKSFFFLTGRVKNGADLRKVFYGNHYIPYAISWGPIKGDFRAHPNASISSFLKRKSRNRQFLPLKTWRRTREKVAAHTTASVGRIFRSSSCI